MLFQDLGFSSGLDVLLLEFVLGLVILVSLVGVELRNGMKGIKSDN